MDAPEWLFVLTDTAYPGSDRIGIFYFLWFLTLMRKARNVIIKLPKVTNSVRIPMNIEIISYAVIITHLPSYVFLINQVTYPGACHPVMGIFPMALAIRYIIPLMLYIFNA